MQTTLRIKYLEDQSRSPSSNQQISEKTENTEDEIISDVKDW